MSSGWFRSETDHEIVFKATTDVLQVFRNRKIFFGRGEHEPIGELIYFPKNAAVEPYTVFPYRHLFQCGSFSYLESSGAFPGLSVGRFCSIAKGLDIFGVRHPLEWVTQSSITYELDRPDPYQSFLAAHRDLFQETYAPCLPDNLERAMPLIEHDVWIGQNVQLARGIRIGSGSVIAAGAVVTRDVEPYTVVAGVPAHPIRHRFPAELSDRLLRSEWWRYHPETVFRYGFSDPALFLDKFERAVGRGEASLFAPPRVTWQEIRDAVSPLVIYENEEIGWLRGGWSQSEGPFTWAVGDRSIIEFPSEVLSDACALTLDLTAVPFRPQRVLVSALGPGGSYPLADEILNAAHSVAFRVDSPMLHRGSLTLELFHPDHVTPAGYGFNDDTRELSVSLNRVAIRHL